MSKVSKKTLSPPMESSSFTYEEIANRAYLIWLEGGSQHGADERDWFKAEQQLREVTSK